MGRLTEQIQQKIHSELLPWAPFPEARLKTESFLSVDKRYTKDKAMGLDIYPDEPNIFSAFAICPPEKVKVVIIGQDPCHGPGGKRMAWPFPSETADGSSPRSRISKSSSFTIWGNTWT